MIVALSIHICQLSVKFIRNQHKEKHGKRT